MTTLQAPTLRLAPANVPAFQSDAPWLNEKFPGRFYVQTMLSDYEVIYYYWLGKTRFTGEGRFLDLGCFFGGSTVAVATGLSENPRATAPLITYDSFVADNYTANVYHHPYREGESFRPIFDVYTTRFRDRLVVREGMLPENGPALNKAHVYPEQEPIEILLIDLAKTWGVHETVLRTFGRHLIPGKSVVVQQDFKWDSYWLFLHMHQLRDCFALMHDLPYSSSVSFRYLGGLEERLEDLWTRDDVPPQRIREVWEPIHAYWAATRSPWATTAAYFAQARQFLEAGLPADAAEVFGTGALALAAAPALVAKNYSHALAPGLYERIAPALEGSPRAAEARSRLKCAMSIIQQAAAREK